MKRNPALYDEESLRQGLHRRLDNTELPDDFHRKLSLRLREGKRTARGAIARRIVAFALAGLMLCGGALAALNWLEVIRPNAPSGARLVEAMLARGAAGQNVAAWTEKNGIRLNMHYAVSGGSHLLMLFSLEAVGDEFPSLRYARFTAEASLKGSGAEMLQSQESWYDAREKRRYVLAAYQFMEKGSPAVIPDDAQICLSVQRLYWQRYGVQELCPMTAECLSSLALGENLANQASAAASLVLERVDIQENTVTVEYQLRQERPLDIELLNGASPDEDWARMRTASLRALTKGEDGAYENLDERIFPPLTEDEQGLRYQEEGLALSAPLDKSSVLALVTDYTGPHIYPAGPDGTWTVAFSLSAKDGLKEREIPMNRAITLGGKEILIKRVLLSLVSVTLEAVCDEDYSPWLTLSTPTDGEIEMTSGTGRGAGEGKTQIEWWWLHPMTTNPKDITLTLVDRKTGEREQIPLVP